MPTIVLLECDHTRGFALFVFMPPGHEIVHGVVLSVFLEVGFGARHICCLGLALALAVGSPFALAFALALTFSLAFALSSSES